MKETRKLRIMTPFKSLVSGISHRGRAFCHCETLGHNVARALCVRESSPSVYFFESEWGLYKRTFEFEFLCAIDNLTTNVMSIRQADFSTFSSLKAVSCCLENISPVNVTRPRVT